MLNTYNLDAVSPRITNKNSSHKICGEAEEKENIFLTCSEKTDLNVNRCRFHDADSTTCSNVGTFLVCKRRDSTTVGMCYQSETCEQSNTENSKFSKCAAPLSISFKQSLVCPQILHRGWSWGAWGWEAADRRPLEGSWWSHLSSYSQVFSWRRRSGHHCWWSSRCDTARTKHHLPNTPTIQESNISI